MKTQRLLGVLIILFLFPAFSFGADRSMVPPGRPFAALQEQINALQASSTYAIYDATGKKVGTVIGMTEIAGYGSPVTQKYPVAVIEYNNQLITLIVAKDRFYSFYQVLHHATPDCTGQSYAALYNNLPGPGNPALVLNPSSPFPFAIVPVNGSVVYVENGTSVPVSDIVILSHKIIDGTCIPGALSLLVPVTFYVPVDPLVDLHSLFTPPFQVRK